MEEENENESIFYSINKEKEISKKDIIRAVHWVGRGRGE